MTEIPAQTGNVTPDPYAAHIRVTRRDQIGDPSGNPPLVVQPWHCALIAANNEKTWWTEQYAERAGVRDAIAWLGRAFSPVDRATVYWPPDSASTGYLAVWLDHQELGEKVHVPIRYVDERAGA